MPAVAEKKGRFDEKIGIHPRDILSRLGRFMDQVEKMNQEKINRGEEIETPNKQKLCEIIQQTGNASMPILGRPGWFTAPKGNYKPNTFFSYVFEEDKECPPIETNAQPTEVIGRGKTAVKEYGQWWWIGAWEKEARKLKDNDIPLERLLKCYPKKHGQLKKLQKRLNK